MSADTEQQDVETVDPEQEDFETEEPVAQDGEQDDGAAESEEQEPESEEVEPEEFTYVERGGLRVAVLALATFEGPVVSFSIKGKGLGKVELFDTISRGHVTIQLPMEHINKLDRNGFFGRDVHVEIKVTPAIQPRLDIDTDTKPEEVSEPDHEEEAGESMKGIRDETGEPKELNGADQAFFDIDTEEVTEGEDVAEMSP